MAVCQVLRFHRFDFQKEGLTVFLPHVLGSSNKNFEEFYSQFTAVDFASIPEKLVISKGQSFPRHQQAKELFRALDKLRMGSVF